MKTFEIAKPAHLILSVLVCSLAACTTVDLAQPTLKQSAVPTCAVQPGDYKILAHWNDRTADKKYGTIIAALEKKYAGAPRVGSTSAVVAAQSYVRQNSDVSPLMIANKVEDSCKSRTK